MSNPKEEDTAGEHGKADVATKTMDTDKDATKDEPMADGKPPAAENSTKKETSTAANGDVAKKSEVEPSEEDFAEEDDVDKEEEELFCSLEKAKEKEELEHAGDEKVAPTLLKDVLENGDLPKSPEAVKEKVKEAAEKTDGDGALVSWIDTCGALQRLGALALVHGLRGRTAEIRSKLP